jgi:hypothetical protein
VTEYKSVEVRKTEQASERFLASLAQCGGDEYPAIISKINTYSRLLAAARPEY